MDRHTDRPKLIGPLNFFEVGEEVGAIKISNENICKTVYMYSQIRSIKLLHTRHENYTMQMLILLDIVKFSYRI